jgi:hypothetical protein
MPYSLAPGRPLILPIYLSSPAFNFVSMTSYNHFCFLQHIRKSAFPNVNPSAVLPSAEGSLRDALAETCYFYAQNLPTIITLLPRAGLALALLISFFSPEHLPGGLTLSDSDADAEGVTDDEVVIPSPTPPAPHPLLRSSGTHEHPDGPMLGFVVPERADASTSLDHARESPDRGLDFDLTSLTSLGPV